MGYQYIGKWKTVYRWSKRKFYGNEYLFRLVNVFSPADLVQSFFLYRLEHHPKDEKHLLGDFREYGADLVRKAKTRYQVRNVYNYTDVDRLDLGIAQSNGVKPKGW